MRSTTIALVLLFMCSPAYAEDLWVPGASHFDPIPNPPLNPIDGDADKVLVIRNRANGYETPIWIGTGAGGGAGVFSYADNFAVTTSLPIHNTFGDVIVRVDGTLGVLSPDETFQTKQASCYLVAYKRTGLVSWTSPAATTPHTRTTIKKGYQLTLTVPRSVLDVAPYVTMICSMVSQQIIHGYRVTFDWGF